MNIQTRLGKLIEIIFSFTWSKLFFFGQNFSIAIFCLFLGFLSGTLFGTFLPFLRIFLPWDGLILLVLLFLIEVINYSLYHETGGPAIWYKSKGLKILNFYKIGLLLGFFIDGFKVGS